ncbi:unnamed protein product [Ixodes persulcatus]
MCERRQSWKREHESSVRSGFAPARELGRNSKSAGLGLLASALLAEKVKRSILQTPARAARVTTLRACSLALGNFAKGLLTTERCGMILVSIEQPLSPLACTKHAQLQASQSCPRVHANMIARQRHQPGRLQSIVLRLLTFGENLARVKPQAASSVTRHIRTLHKVSFVCSALKTNMFIFLRISAPKATFAAPKHCLGCSKSRFYCSKTLFWLLRRPHLLLQSAVLGAPKCAPKWLRPITSLIL